MDHSVVALQETRGCEAGMLLLPATHRYFGSFATLIGPASSSSGGVVMAIRKDLADRATRSYSTAHSRGRAIMASLHMSAWVHITTVHVEPALPFADKRRLLANIAEWHTSAEGLNILPADWNFLASDECRMAGDGTDLISDNNMGAFFDDRFPLCIELMQRDFTFRRLSREAGGASVFSRIDRVYIEVHPTAMEDVTTTVTVRGAIGRRTAPSDHRAVCVSLSLRAPGRRIVQPQAIANTRFGKVLADELARYGAPQTPGGAYDGIVQAAHAAHAQVKLAPSVGATATPHQMVEVALRIFRLHRSARSRAALQLGGVFPQTREAIDNGTGDVHIIRRVFQENLDQCIALDVAELKRSRMLDLMKAAKKQKIRWSAEPYRPKRKWVLLDGGYTRDGTPIDDDEAVSQAIVDDGHRSSRSGRRTKRRCASSRRISHRAAEPLHGHGPEAPCAPLQSDAHILPQAPIASHTPFGRRRPRMCWNLSKPRPSRCRRASIPQRSSWTASPSSSPKGSTLQIWQG